MDAKTSNNMLQIEMGLDSELENEQTSIDILTKPYPIPNTPNIIYLLIYKINNYVKYEFEILKIFLIDVEYFGATEAT